ncbi:hypothetical protein BDV30DRAFT_219029 [Aspergillus minisclerotigenes]|uniref:Uncharacterized protein n=1 Tax=Aspergillus minisclerotigenes TaxID=656917 RepID=A0A5N6IMX4_9EURO|nr:hypothetical protein BDV30DRAFT_219029 [Aspergillus minisclerotigenes]
MLVMLVSCFINCFLFFPVIPFLTPAPNTWGESRLKTQSSSVPFLVEVLPEQSN